MSGADIAWGLGLLVTAAVIVVVVGVARHRQRRHAGHRQREQTLGMLEAIAEASTDAIFAKDTQGRYIFSNRAHGAALGLACADVIGRTDAELVGVSTAGAFTHNDRLTLESTEARSFEEVVPTAQGDRISLCVKGPLFDAQRRLIGLFGVARDVTETRRAERALRDSELHYRTVFSVMSEGILVNDASGAVLSCNPMAERIVGVPQIDWQGRAVVAPGWTPIRPDGSVMPAEETPPGVVLAGGPAQHDVLLHTRDPDGRDTYFEINALPVMNPDDGSLMAVVTSFADVTRRRLLEAEVAQHRQQLENLVARRTHELQQANASLESAALFNRTLADNLPGGIAYWDSEMRCQFINRNYQEWFGKPMDELLGQTFDDLHGESYSASVKLRVFAARTGVPQHFEGETTAWNGRTRISQIHYIPEARPVGSAGRNTPHGIFVMAFDITQLKRAQHELGNANRALVIARDKAEAAAVAKSTFLANMSHEIRTPMNAIIGLTHLLQRESLPLPAKDRLDRIGDAATHLMGIINNILDLSKIEAGAMSLDVVDFNLDTRLSRAFALVIEQARAKGLELLIDTDHVPRLLRGDASRLSQALVNLLANAVKFTERGSVALAARVVERQGASLLVRFEVHDTGIGVEPHRIDDIFNAFQQADTSTTRRFGGTGLGLGITRHLARLMGGDAGATSQPGVGSVFWLTARLEAQPGNRADAPRLPGKRTLLIDDMAEVREVVGGMLQRLGLRVDTAASGASALQLATIADNASDPYEIVLVDGLMPGMDGLETVRALRARSRGSSSLLCVIVSSVNDESLVRRATAAGARAVLQKPVSMSALFDGLAALVAAPADGAMIESRPMALDSQSEQIIRQRHAGARVLVAEDNAVNREVAVTLLEMVGLTVDVAERGDTAVDRASVQRYDLILMDMQMPGLDGPDATRVLRAHPATAKVPIIAMTANAYTEDRAACLAAGMNDFIAKPVDPQVLYDVLLAWLPA